ncbi:hypothetical protein HUJ04_012123 [Dendroctonus ponderosae]|uniref:Uncharacterized protein n=1 Tax=Dendroctonus ponderosae TaxID=77166 RepID=A0AAR5Q632_DENPD|nr:hypothetical protein HUJ04_012123 [Dendroctonus ponderosae]
MARLALFAVCFIAGGYAEEVVKISARDSYLEAYEDSKAAPKAQKKSDFGYPVYPGPANSGYGPPSPQYGPPSPQYGPPSPQYGPPSPQYGPPAPHYGPSYGSFAEPTPQYGPPAQNLQVFYGVPHAMISIWDKVWEKVKWKLDLLTFGKILLKLIIFKKIVSFIAILFLLLFIPSFKKKKGFFSEDSEQERALSKSSEEDQRLNEIAAFVGDALRKFMIQNEEEESCSGKYCAAMRRIEKKLSYQRLAQLYARE